ncbi:redoxin domain-containing protein [Paenibacillus agaridevorans]|uniref:redoxin domain-containing protein n=1 Tax=Paenibacillus agaridevorans TaxID=171404 RepID=UPI001FECD03D|nr:redoxin domain-containing protein [Paenibacillus agaridevorans]
MKLIGPNRKFIQISILIVVLVIGGFAIGKTFIKTNNYPQVGGEPPEFELTDMEGNVHRLSDYKGKPYIINFWGTFCPPCVKEMPEFQRQYEKWGSKGLNVLAINLSEDDLTVKNFLRKFELENTILRDREKATERRYGLKAYPTTYFVKADGTIMKFSLEV